MMSFKPGIILQDIIRSIVTSDVIVAEVTPANPNVFYELGYAHAIEKPTILLAEKPTDSGRHLPFDISGFRVIFYDNTIKENAPSNRHCVSICRTSEMVGCSVDLERLPKTRPRVAEGRAYTSPCSHPVSELALAGIWGAP